MSACCIDNWNRRRTPKTPPSALIVCVSWVLEQKGFGRMQKSDSSQKAREVMKTVELQQRNPSARLGQIRNSGDLLPHSKNLTRVPAHVPGLFKQSEFSHSQGIIPFVNYLCKDCKMCCGLMHLRCTAVLICWDSI